MVDYVEKTFVCKNCGTEFPFTAGEQAFYESKGIKKKPSLCPECRAQRHSTWGRSKAKEGKKKFPAICASCGVHTRVPFKPSHDRPVYCKECYQREVE